jgi:TonB family protein
MILGSTKKRNRFWVVKVTREGIHSDEKALCRKRFEVGLMVSLLCMILVFGLSRRMPRGRQRKIEMGPYAILALDPVPVTNPGGIPRPPDLPQVPIPTEDEYLPEDETIDDTKLVLTEGIPLFEGTGRRGGGVGGMGPRPIREVIPEYPKEARDRGVEGIVELAILVNQVGGVDSVRVLWNTTKSKRLERAAIQAAYKSRYFPAQRDGKRIAYWIQRPYRFERR